IVRMVAERAPSRDTVLAAVSEQVDQELRNAKIKVAVTGRPKHYYSIYQKMIVRGRDFADIYDLVGLRVLVETERDCYAAVGVIHTIWSPLPGRFKDYIAMPKFNMYQSLHTTVIGPDGKTVEVQIRTHQMHKRSEYGIAAHWKYKEQYGDQQDMTWLRQLVDWQRETQDPGEFLDSLRFDLHANEVFVFTPKGDVIALPAGATPVDFAYSVHTEVGHRCSGCSAATRSSPSPRTCGSQMSLRSTQQSVKAICPRRPSYNGWCTPWAGRKAPSRTSPRPPVQRARSRDHGPRVTLACPSRA